MMSHALDNFINYISPLTADQDIPSWSGYMPSKVLGNEVRFFDLPAVIRALMIADGTVTMALEVIYQEPIKVELIEQHALVLERAVALLNLAEGEEAFYREVELVGQHSGKRYVRAYSLLKKDALSSALWDKLRNKEVGMGVVLRNASQGSFRKVLHIGMGDIDGATDKTNAHRTYSVNIENEPAILITEVFSLEALARD